MPELPEVETTRRGLLPHLRGHQLGQLQVHQPRLRWPVPDDLGQRLAGRTVVNVTGDATGALYLARVEKVDLNGNLDRIQ